MIGLLHLKKICTKIALEFFQKLLDYRQICATLADEKLKKMIIEVINC